MRSGDDGRIERLLIAQDTGGAIEARCAATSSGAMAPTPSAVPARAGTRRYLLPPKSVVIPTSCPNPAGY